MHEDYVDRTSVKDTEIYYLEDNTYDEYNESGRWMVVINESVPMKDNFFLSSFHKDCYIFLCTTILQRSDIPYPMLS